MLSKYLFRILSLFLFLIGTNVGNAQVTYNTSQLKIEKKNTINFSSIDDKYLAESVNLEAPSVSGNSYKHYLNQLKEEIEKTQDESFKTKQQANRGANVPVVSKGIELSGLSIGIPLDNDLAMNEEMVLSVGNFYVAVYDTSNTKLKVVTLQSFAVAAGISAQSFDPRVLYDTESERFVLVFLAGFESTNTHIVVAFSQTKDPTGDWNIYEITGNPNEAEEWTDYPMISITKNDLFVTINLLKDDSSWQTGFLESIIWQMDKQSGYDGSELVITKWDDVNFNGKSIRNLCPLESATEELYDDIYFLSDRNFDVENDTFLLLNLKGHAGDTLSEMSVDYRLSNNPYGVPPNAVQFFGRLQTNDARVLEGFRLGNEIQFVGNTKNFEANKAGIFHGILRDITDATAIIELNHLLGEDYELGYPGITYTGEGGESANAILSFNHSSKTRFPGISACFYVDGIGYSDIVTVKEGKGYIDLISGTIERWGDYFGTQRNYNNPSEVWISGFFGATNHSNSPFTALLLKPDNLVPTQDVTNIEASSIKIFPTPSVNRVNIEFNLPAAQDNIDILLYDIQGRLVDELYHIFKAKKGRNLFSFDASSLASGNYTVVFNNQGNILFSKQIVIQ